MFRIFQKYIILKFFKSLTLVTLIFSIVILIMNLLEEISYLKEVENSILIPIYLTLLNLPSILFETFPFIFLISSIFLFYQLIEIEELKTFKYFGVTNFKIIQTLSLTSFVVGILIITIFYNISSNLKYFYLEKKNNYSKDDKYLAVSTANGLWIRDVNEKNINFINAEEMNNDTLFNVTITVFSKNFDIIETIIARSAIIKNNNWILEDVTISKNNVVKKYLKYEFYSNFDIKKILSFFNNLTGLNLIKIEKLKKDYEALGYSNKFIKIYQQKIYSYPLYLTIMFVIGSLIMLNIGYNKSKVFHIIIGIIVSVIIYYLNYFFSNVLESKDVSVFISVWGLQIILSLFIITNIFKVNEK